MNMRDEVIDFLQSVYRGAAKAGELGPVSLGIESIDLLLRMGVLDPEPPSIEFRCKCGHVWKLMEDPEERKAFRCPKCRKWVEVPK